jgi:MraZ protein
MFRGRYEHSVDAKGRIALPSRFREVLQKRYADDRLVITRHLTDPCLVIYPLEEWEAFEERLAKLSQVDPKVTALRRLYVGTAHELSLDKQGRLLCPPDLRRDAAIERECIWSGHARFLELWSESRYEQHVEAARERFATGDFKDVLEKLAELGI